MKVLGVIPARGGSKGIPRKNLVPLLGRPLLAYTVEAALQARKLDRVVLSTDDEEVAAVGRDLGVEVPYLRPAELAQDDTPTIPVLQDLVRRLEAEGASFDAVCTLQPTTPLREAADIDGAVELLQSTTADAVISFVDVGEHHPARMKWIDEQQRVHNPSFAEQFEGQPRQQLPPMFLREGSIYLTRTAVLMQQSSLQGDDCRAWLVPRHKACNIDEPLDLQWAEFLLQQRAAEVSLP